MDMDIVSDLSDLSDHEACQTMEAVNDLAVLYVVTHRPLKLDYSLISLTHYY